MNITQEKHVEIGGQKRLVKFGTNATAIYCDKHDLSLGQFQQITFQKIKPGQLRDIIWSGLVAGAKKEGKEIDFDEFDVGDWIDEIDQDTIDDIFALLQGPEAGKKKKVKD